MMSDFRREDVTQHKKKLAHYKTLLRLTMKRKIIFDFMQNWIKTYIAITLTCYKNFPLFRAPTVALKLIYQ